MSKFSVREVILSISIIKSIILIILHLLISINLLRLITGKLVLRNPITGRISSSTRLVQKLIIGGIN